MCKVDGCDMKHEALGYCNVHYHRFLRHGDPDICLIKYHGMENTPEYRTWHGIKCRTLSERSKDYANYGARGITICEEWKNDFMAFYRDMGPKPSKNSQIDRINNNFGYSPGNCRWTSSVENSRNRRSNVLNRMMVGMIKEMLSRGIDKGFIQYAFGVRMHVINDVILERCWKGVI